MRLPALLLCLMCSSPATAAGAEAPGWISYTFVGGFGERQIAQSTTWINETCKPDEIGNITGFSYTSSQASKLGVSIFCHEGSGKLGKVKVSRVKFDSAYGFKTEQLRSPTAVVIGFEFEKADNTMEPVGEVIMVVKE